MPRICLIRGATSAAPPRAGPSRGNHPDDDEATGPLGPHPLLGCRHLDLHLARSGRDRPCPPRSRHGRRHLARRLANPSPPGIATEHAPAGVSPGARRTEEIVPLSEEDKRDGTMGEWFKERSSEDPSTWDYGYG